MSSNAHNGLVAGLGLRELSDGVVPKVVEARPGERALESANFGFALRIRALFRRLL
jgi:hypothetical protein